MELPAFVYDQIAAVLIVEAERSEADQREQTVAPPRKTRSA